MVWVEEHPFKMSLIVGLFILTFAMLYHYKKVVPNNWGDFALWSLLCFLLPLMVAALSWISEKRV